MKNKQNLHTHTTYCDGKHTPEELILEALRRGFDSLGFSEHSYMHFSSFANQLTIDKMERYKDEVCELKKKYKGKIDIFCGLEVEFFSEVPLDNFDYLIGSVHYLKFGQEILSFDVDKERTQKYIADNFDGDGIAFSRKYFETVSELPRKANFDIIGHFDLQTKNNETGRFIDTTSKKYIDLGLEAIHSLKGKIPLFEVNTGAISRGYRNSPYPQMEFLREFQRLGFGAVISTDCHDKNFLDCFYEEAGLLLKEAGFKSKWILTDKGFKEVEI
jgi:histidinol-phosphatase (PHP family)